MDKLQFSGSVHYFFYFLLFICRPGCGHWPGIGVTLHLTWLTCSLRTLMFGGRLKSLNFWLLSATIFSHCSNFCKTQCNYHFTYLPGTSTFKGVAKSVPTPCESQKQPKSLNVEVQNCLEFNLASIY